MAGIRENILASSEARDGFLRGVVLLDQERPGINSRDVFQFLQRNVPGLRMRGITQNLSTYDLFVLWHVVAMSFPMPPGNAAHSGPIFLPWHRMYLIRLEQQLQRVLGNNDFGLPYWDWAADGELPIVEQWRAQLWTQEYLGESRNRVRSGELDDMRVRLWQNMRGVLWSINERPIERAAGLDARSLPRQRDVGAALQETLYDQDPWSQSAIGHRNRLEGWPRGPQLHNRIHVWIGGDMGPGTSPNDPAFFLNHCNVDRIWEAWMARHGRIYQPGANEGPVGHQIDDLMVSLLDQALRPQDVLDPAQWYRYDSLTVN